MSCRPDYGLYRLLPSLGPLFLENACASFRTRCASLYLLCFHARPPERMEHFRPPGTKHPANLLHREKHTVWLVLSGLPSSVRHLFLSPLHAKKQVSTEWLTNKTFSLRSYPHSKVLLDRLAGHLSS